MIWGFELRHMHNVLTLRRAPLAEISGAFGDLGTLLPLMTALAYNGSISLSSTLVFTGLFNITTGLIFGIPLPVQPMKAIAAAAITSHASIHDTVASGALVSAAVLILAITGLLRFLAAWVPVPVVKGIQLGAGTSLIMAAASIIKEDNHVAFSWLRSNWIWTLIAFLGLLATQRPLVLIRGGRAYFFPYALVAFCSGIVVILAEHYRLKLSPWQPQVIIPHWKSGDAWAMAVAQLPLTTLNSVVAVSALATDLFSGQEPFASAGANRMAPPASVTAFGYSVGAMNLIGCWFGVMPVCHGAGGLAAQYRFGARSGASIMLLGFSKIILGFLFGETLASWLRVYPRSILSVLVLAAGLELASASNTLNHGASDLWQGETLVAETQTNGAISQHNSGRLGSRQFKALSEEERKERWTVMLMTAGCILGFKNDAIGFAAGMLCHWSFRLFDKLAAREPLGVGERRPLLS